MPSGYVIRTMPASYVTGGVNQKIWAGPPPPESKRATMRLKNLACSFLLLPPYNPVDAAAN